MTKLWVSTNSPPSSHSQRESVMTGIRTLRFTAELSHLLLT